MAHWIEQKSAHGGAREDERQSRRAQALELLEQLEQAVRQDVEKWNQLNPKYRRRFEGVFKTVPGAFQVRKESFPSAMLDVLLAPDSTSIQIVRTGSLRGSHTTQTWREQFGLMPEPNGGLRLLGSSGEPLSLEAASRALLEPIVESIGEAG
jgi:hypothetical protein